MSLTRPITRSLTRAITRALTAPGSGGGFAEYVHIFSYGQSLSVGERSTPVQNSTSRFDTVSFVGGVRALDTLTSPSAYASFIPLVENTGGPNSAASYGNILTPGETPLFGACAAINERNSGRDYRLIGTASGFGATSITNLSKGTTPYNRMLGQVTSAKALADAEGKGYRVGGILWLQGEWDLANATYSTQLQTLASDLDADIRAITGQSESVPLVSYQTRGGFAVAKQQLAAALASPLVHIGSPVYFCTFHPDKLHLDGPGIELAGAHLGRALSTLLQGGSWDFVRPLSVSFAGTYIDILMNVPVAPLVIDTTTISNPGFNGFSIFNPSMVAKAATVSIVSSTTIRLTTAETITAGWTVNYQNSQFVNRGNIRDSAGTLDRYDPDGRDAPLNNWAVAFEVVTT